MKLIIMQGLPASGKSTRAAEIMKEDGNAVRINKDLLRTMLHFDKFTGRNEELTFKAARLLANYFLDEGKNVIIDDTNLNPKTLQGWVDLAKAKDARIQHVVMDTPVGECIVRDETRQKKVGRSTIVGMAMQRGLYPKPEAPVVICDLDGTLADIKHRLPLVKNLPEGAKKDWEGFFAGIPQDEVRKDTEAILQDYVAQGREIFFVSGRPDSTRAATEAWLESIGWAKSYEALFMRASHDKRPDTEVKAEIFDRHFKDIPVEAVIDDRPSVIRMWREKGLHVIDVGEGIEF